MQEENVINKQEMVASCFNDYFINMAKDIGPDDCLYVEDNVTSCTVKYEHHVSIETIKTFMECTTNNFDFNFQDIDTRCVKTLLQQLNCHKATGYDLLPAKILKIASQMLCFPLLMLVNFPLH